ncbi:hypothetical protein AGOR_G00130440 [Albula goreensis]|uniref:Uncharacterized protein n=1 Tax=Albula goreensis TaxID=1534307 RepID=A0A8T3D3H3_9TELE|nr:hypothetical protein AGOR_G00130440 [Albula goreensis]
MSGLIVIKIIRVRKDFPSREDALRGRYTVIAIFQLFPTAVWASCVGQEEKTSGLHHKASAQHQGKASPWSSKNSALLTPP